MDPHSVTSVLIRERQREIWHTMCEGNVKTEAEDWPQPKNASSHWKLDEARWGKEGILSRASRALISTPWCWFQTSGFQNCERINSWCFKAPNLWQYKIAATGNEYSYYSSFFFLTDEQTGLRFMWNLSSFWTFWLHETLNILYYLSQVFCYLQYKRSSW